MKFEHTSVLRDESIEYLAIQPNKTYIDGTLGGGGHAYEILTRSGPKGVLLGIDRDPAALSAAGERLASFGKRSILVNDTYDNIRSIAYDHGIQSVHGILLDLGVSSYQLADPTRGFSFQGDFPLDMRMGAGATRTAADIVNTWDADALQDIFSRYGEERYSKTIARAIVEAREQQPFTTTGRLVAVIQGVYAGRPRPKIHPATKVFQALRIAVNDELGILEKCLREGIELLEPGGRFVVITFHSLEDRIVKHVFKEQGVTEKRNKYGAAPVHTSGLRIITKKPILPSAQEITRNPRARSAKLRVVEKI